MYVPAPFLPFFNAWPGGENANRQQLGLSIVPLLPTLFDAPIEHAISWSFRTALQTYFGPDAVRSLPDAAEANDDSTSLSRFLSSRGPATGADAKEMARSWDEYRDERRRAKEERRKARGTEGREEEGSALGVLKGFVSSVGGGGDDESGRKNK